MFRLLGTLVAVASLLAASGEDAKYRALRRTQTEEAHGNEEADGAENEPDWLHGQPTCGDIYAEENVNCTDSVKWALVYGQDQNPSWYFVELDVVSKVTLESASIEDMQRVFYCGKGLDGKKCGLPPCHCSHPPCHTCQAISPAPRIRKPYKLAKRFRLDQEPEQEWDRVVIPDAYLTHSCANYTEDPSTVFSRDGQLVLKVASACRDQKCLNSGRLMSKDAFKYGIFTFSATIPKCNYVWPALWLLPSSTQGDGKYGTWPCSGEIDLLESVHDDTFGAFNLVAGYGSTGGARGTCFAPAKASCNRCLPPYYCTSTTLADQVASHYHVEDVNCSAGDRTWKEHVFALFWEKDQIAAFIDPTFTYDRDGNMIGIKPKQQSLSERKKYPRTYKSYERHVTPTWKAVKEYMDACFPEDHGADAPFDKDFKIVLNIAVGGYEGSPCQWGQKACVSKCGGAVGQEMILSDISVWQQD